MVPFLPVLLACAEWFSVPATVVEAPTPLPAVRVEGPVWTAVVTTAPRTTPGRFAAGLPPDLLHLNLHPEEWPPVGHIAEAICAEAEARTQLSARLTDVPGGVWGDVLEGCRDPDYCAWVGGALADDTQPAEARATLWSGLLACDDAASEALATSDGAPDDIVLLWAFRHEGPATSRLLAATETSLKQPDRPWPGVLGLEVLGGADGDDAVSALRRLHRVVHPSYREAVAHAMWGREASDLQRLHRSACAREPHHRCGQERLDPLDDLAGALQDWRVDPTALLSDFPQHSDAIGRGLEACTRDLQDDDPYRSRECLLALARSDRTRAREVATTLEDPFEILADLRGALAAADPAALRGQLEDLGFGPFRDSDAGPAPLTAVEWLLRSDAALRLEPPDTWPPQQERGLRRMARLAGVPDLVFAELLPDPEALTTGQHWPRPTLYAWHGGLRFRTLSLDEGGWDFEHGVGLVNAVLAHAGHDNRVALTTHDGVVVAVVAPPGVLASLGEGGLVDWLEPTPPMGPDAALLDTGIVE